MGNGNTHNGKDYNIHYQVLNLKRMSMTTRRKFLTATGILAGMAAIGKPPSIEDLVKKEEGVVICIDSVGGDSSFNDFVSECEPIFCMTQKDTTTYYYRGKKLTVKGVFRSQMSDQDLLRLDAFLK